MNDRAGGAIRRPFVIPAECLLAPRRGRMHRASTAPPHAVRSAGSIGLPIPRRSSRGALAKPTDPCGGAVNMRGAGDSSPAPLVFYPISESSRGDAEELIETRKSFGFPPRLSVSLCVL